MEHIKDLSRTEELENLISLAREQAGVADVMDVFSHLQEHMNEAQAFMSTLLPRTVTTLSNSTSL